MGSPVKTRIWQAAIPALLAVGLCTTNEDAWPQIQASEPDLKAAIIINMTLFVDWPTNSALPTDRLNICFLDDSPVARALGKSQGKNLRNRTITVSRVDPESLSECHVVYLSSGERSQLPQVSEALQNIPILIAGDSSELLARGIMLNLELSAGHVVFDINLRAAKKARLQISSKAIRLARQVIE